MNKQWSAEGFWQFSLDTYSNSNVQKCCLALQNEAGFNINLLLLCCYLEQSNAAFAEDDISYLRNVIKNSDLAIQTHRKVRKEAKLQDENRYNSLLAQELELERQQQQQLINSIQTLRLQPTRGVNLQVYLNNVCKENESIQGLAQKRINDLRTLTTNQ